MPSIKHIVLIKFKPEMGADRITAIFSQLAGLQNRIAGITDFIHGRDMSTEGLGHGFTHGFVMTFETAAARDAYLPHPEHERVKQAILPLVEDVLVIDFEV